MNDQTNQPSQSQPSPKKTPKISRAKWSRQRALELPQSPMPRAGGVARKSNDTYFLAIPGVGTVNLSKASDSRLQFWARLMTDTITACNLALGAIRNMQESRVLVAKAKAQASGIPTETPDVQ